MLLKAVGEVEAHRSLQRCVEGARRLLKALGVLEMSMKIVENDEISRKSIFFN